MKNIYMVQPNSQYGNSIYFPYAAGTLVAYAFKSDIIKQHYLFKGFVYKKDDINIVVDGIEAPFFVGFSCYVWNYEYNIALAKLIKERFPECKIAFGGHQINEKSPTIDFDFIDYVTVGEGEEGFKQLLLYLCGEEEIENVPNLIYKRNNKAVKTSVVASQIADRASAYLDGWFDELVESSDIEFSAILETNRGCPNKCAFCDWGNIKARVHHYDLDMVFAEIDWMAKNRIEYCYCADANFGLFPRDMKVVDYIIKKHNETGYPQKFQATYSKNNVQVVFEINQKLNAAGMSKGATLSFQSMSQATLNNIYRRNMPLESFLNLMTLYNTNNIPTYSELILGLPGETYDSFKDGIETLLECGQHMAINIFNCEILSNAIMNSDEYLNTYKIKFAKTQQHQYHVVQSTEAIKEYSNIVVSTATMPLEAWIQSNIFGVFVRAFHNLGLLQCFAIYLFYEKGIKYKDFYCDLIDFARKNPKSFCARAYTWLFNKYSEVSQSKGSLTGFDPDFGELTWPLEEYVFLQSIKEYDNFYAEVKGFLQAYFDDCELFNDLLAYQKSVVKYPRRKSVLLKLKYDFNRYFSNVYNNTYEKLIQRENTIKIQTDDVPDTLPEYAAKIIWFGRKGGQNIANEVHYLDS